MPLFHLATKDASRACARLLGDTVFCINRKHNFIREGQLNTSLYLFTNFLCEFFFPVAPKTTHLLYRSTNGHEGGSYIHRVTCVNRPPTSTVIEFNIKLENAE